jgi:hypothetical protein
LNISHSQQLASLSQNLSKLDAKVTQRLDEAAPWKAVLCEWKGVCEGFTLIEYAACIADDAPNNPSSPEIHGIGLAVCQEGTRVAILERIKTWGKDALTQKQIWWLRDAAGTGKTTVASTMVRHWKATGALAGRFFFTRSLRAASEIEKFCPALARDVAHFHAPLRPMIGGALMESSAIRSEFEEQFELLIVAPLSRLDKTAILIIDALDNCEASGRERILKAFLHHLPSVPKMKLLFTSRPLLDIDELLERSEMIEGRDIQLHDVHGDATHPDIALYMEKQLEKLSRQERQMLVVQSQGLFIWASTACQLLRKTRKPSKILKDLMDVTTSDHLDHLYREVLEQALVDPSSLDALVRVLQVIITVFEPVSIRTVEAFLPHQEAVNTLIQDLSSVVKDGDPDRPLIVLHDTFREFLANERRANGYMVNSMQAHTTLAIGCVELLSTFLKYDMFGISGDGLGLEANAKRPELLPRIEKELTAALKYAATHWAYHGSLALEDGAAKDVIERFMRTKVLNLAELMSLRQMFGGFAMAIAYLDNSAKDLQRWNTVRIPISFMFYC